MKTFKKLAVAAALSVTLPAFADVIFLDFEGIGNQMPVGDFYNGGGGPNYGVSFSDATLAIIDADAGGTGNIANEPSPDTVMFFLDANNAILNALNGFDTGFSFYYSSAFAATVTVWDGLDGTGNLLGSIDLDAQYNIGCSGDPNGQYCNWTPIGVAFAGTAMSINFGGTANYTAYDNITFGADVPVIPEPSSYALMALGLAGIGLATRRRRNT
ncbi:MAG: PEP-CTERM sorting domain-containing protein [Burkholderiaceae bacterium]|nr:PEP-CTERM sorting domain-containing protein [Burkholderiaceae bacterium]